MWCLIDDDHRVVYRTDSHADAVEMQGSVDSLTKVVWMEVLPVVR